MAPTRPTRPRLIPGAAAVVATVAAAVLAAADPGPLADVVRMLGALSTAAAVVGVVGGFAAWGSITAFLLGAAFVATLHGEASVVDARTPAMAAAVLVAAELVTWAAEQRSHGTTVAGATVPRPLFLIGCGVAAFVVASLLGAVVALPVGRDLAVTAIGAAAVAAVTVVLVGLARGRAAG